MRNAKVQNLDNIWDLLYTIVMESCGCDRYISDTVGVQGRLVIHPCCHPPSADSCGEAKASAAHGKVADEIPDQRQKLDYSREECEDGRSELYGRSEVSAGRTTRGKACTSRDGLQMHRWGVENTPCMHCAESTGFYRRIQGSLTHPHGKEYSHED